MKKKNLLMTVLSRSHFESSRDSSEAKTLKLIKVYFKV